MVTGATAGIGEAIALGCARVPSSHVILIGRAEDRCKSSRDRIVSITKNSNVSYEVVDLSSYAAINKFTSAYVASGKPLHVLVNNAATCPASKALTADGLEMQWAVNQMGYYWMTLGLLDSLKKSAPSRVVLVASDYAGDLRVDDLNYDKRKYSTNSAYMQSKQANRILAVEFAKMFSPFNISVNCYHPGGIKSKLAQDLGFSLSGTPEAGASTGIMLATTDVGQKSTGKYFIHGKETKDSLVQDAELNKKVMEACARITDEVKAKSKV